MNAEKEIRMVAVSRSSDPSLPIEEYHGLPDGEQLEIHEAREHGKFLYSEYDKNRNQVGETREFDHYSEAYITLKKRENQIMGWKNVGGEISLRISPRSDVVY